MADAVSHAWIFIVLGLTSGCAYALTASGIVTVYRGSGVLNFSHCAVGMAGAYGFYAFLPVYLDRTFALGYAKIGVIAALTGGLAVGLGIIAGGFVADTLARRSARWYAARSLRCWHSRAWPIRWNDPMAFCAWTNPAWSCWPN